jgi:hypothetical protein
LFYRLNQPTALTAAEQRNAFFGVTRKQIKYLVSELNKEDLEYGFLGFSNARMAYEDMLSRVAVLLEHNSLKKRVSAGELADRFRAGNGFDELIINSLLDVIGLCGASKAYIREAPKFNKATAQSWLVFLASAKRCLGNFLTPAVVGGFISEFEAKRFECQIGLVDESMPVGRLRALLMRTYEDRSAARVSDALSVQTRDFVIWHNDLLRVLDCQLKDASSDSWQHVEKIVSMLNWGDPLWQ